MLWCLCVCVFISLSRVLEVLCFVNDVVSGQAGKVNAAGWDGGKDLICIRRLQTTTVVSGIVIIVLEVRSGQTGKGERWLIVTERSKYTPQNYIAYCYYYCYCYYCCYYCLRRLCLRKVCLFNQTRYYYL